MFYTCYVIMTDKSKIPNAFIHCKSNLTRQGNEYKIRYFFMKGGTSWSSCNYGISGKCRQYWLKTNSLLVLPQALMIWNHIPFLTFCLHIYFQ